LENQPIDSLNLKKWNRKIINNYWLILLVSVSVSSLNILFTKTDIVVYIFHFILYPTITLLIFLILIELLTAKVNPQLNSYFIIFCGGIITFTLINSHPTIRGIESILLIPLLSSCIYFRKEKVIFASATSILFYFALLLFNPIILADARIIQVIAMVTILLFGGLIATNIMTRGVEILHHLENSIKSSQELMISKILIEKMAKTDALTGVNNHRAFQEFTDHLLNHSHGNTLHLAIIDLDNFKDINDTFGHQIGDLILKYTAKVLQDISSEHDFIARYGGEEFIIIFTETTEEDSIKKAEEIRVQISKTKHKEIGNESITVSMGLHSFTDNMTKDEWFAGADHALYKAKHSGKNKVVVYQKDVNTLKGESS
jgi:diguanylate cyclase (GGDEF)-like protein